MLYFFYYLTAIILPIVFYKYIHITSLSVVPLSCVVLSVFMAIYYHNNRQKESLNYTISSVELTDKEYAQITDYSSTAHRLCIPLYLPFILFFGNTVKFLSLLIFLFAFVSGPVFFRIKHNDAMQARLNAEENERREQIQKEELGRFN